MQITHQLKLVWSVPYRGPMRVIGVISVVANYKRESDQYMKSLILETEAKIAIGRTESEAAKQVLRENAALIAANAIKHNGLLRGLSSNKSDVAE